MPMALMFDALTATLGPRAAALDFLVALGTHQPMSDEHLGRLIGRPVVEGRPAAAASSTTDGISRAPSPPWHDSRGGDRASCPAGS